MSGGRSVLVGDVGPIALRYGVLGYVPFCVQECALTS
jgi:hypothetical protein